MKVASSLVISWTTALFTCISFAGEPPSPEDLEPRPLPSLEQRVSESNLIVHLHLETKKHEVVGRIVEVLKGKYDPREYPDDPKGFFAIGIPASKYKWDHEEEIWFLAKPEILYAPSDTQPNQDSIIFRGAKVYYQRLILPVLNGVVKYPTVGRRYHDEVIKTSTHKSTDFISHIRTIASDLSVHDAQTK